ncbi:CDP-alcohol phosphatidyltransferase family protein [Ignisphaera sp. 4213-co]|uniref:CDP-alcohol phosphatidyltransferase family protein n=1 Tax=Ignisphaera cupida TaxID=3050454 RepID=A0ABD4Z6V9_9CREN|nr:CDP-alcohol phosphatidyltransferase family protein [Ignisphaera sp. 4213-co]MDK6029071.1 CDP-alcohol phosphatidyltransferase family protein [Ignisphaera sp. 4213-co]
MLGKFRNSVSNTINSFAKKINVNPNVVTLFGLITSFASILIVLIRFNLIIVPLLVIVSGIADVLDGAIARTRKRVTAWGSVLDSFCDRVVEANFLISLMLIGINSLLVSLALVTSFLMSYLRALGEGKGVKLEGVGILEHGERMIILFLSSLVIAIDLKHGVYIATLLMDALIILGVISIVQRLHAIYKKLHGA